jgi:hypothetical protein
VAAHRGRVSGQHGWRCAQRACGWHVEVIGELADGAELPTMRSWAAAHRGPGGDGTSGSGAEGEWRREWVQHLDVGHSG